MISSVTTAVVRHHRLVLAVTTAALIVAGVGGAVPLRSRDGTSALVLGRQDSADAAAIDRIDALARTSSAAGFDVRVGGGNAVGDAIGTTIQADLAKAEAVAVPVSLVLLVFAFGSLVAASLPLAIGAVAVVGTLLALRLLAAVTDVSVYSVNLTTALGLGLAVDYSLFVVTRYREELRRGLATEAATIAAARTAGRTVLFSGLTVALSLAVLPALLAALGPRIDAVDVGAWVRRRLGRPPRRAPGEGTGLWHRLAMLVMRRPVVLGTAVVVLLLGLGLPFLGVHFGLPDDRVLAPGASGRQVADVLRSDFASQETAALSVVAPEAGDPASPARAPGRPAGRSARRGRAGRARVAARPPRCPALQGGA